MKLSPDCRGERRGERRRNMSKFGPDIIELLEKMGLVGGGDSTGAACGKKKQTPPRRRQGTWF